MRKLWLAVPLGAGLIFAAAPAAAQQVWQNGRWVVLPPSTAPIVMPVQPHNWGPLIDGRWEAGYRAPGGWAAYRRLDTGAELPAFWRGYRIPNYLALGLAAPPQGYSWVRYYDDAVLVDARGRVWTSVNGIAWNGAAPAVVRTATSSAPAVVQAGASYPRRGTASGSQPMLLVEPLPQPAMPKLAQASAVQVAPVAIVPVTVPAAPVASAPAAVQAAPVRVAAPVQTAAVAVQAAPAVVQAAPVVTVPAVQTMVGAMQPAPVVMQIPMVMQAAPAAVQAMPQGNVQTYSAGGVTVIVIQPAPVVTTTRVVRETR
ncbi:MAG: RcnB family protein [Sphingomonas sp.]|uniref:RcnB family protein n=1 Tax=Sphingomonas sp. TaxID=28214 RepID=UPI001B2E48E6|nr:RcnB family protein [Sphingomonas sp.]MBO9621141.1 RcnB family protein [Sphingomonas sp.]